MPHILSDFFSAKQIGGLCGEERKAGSVKSTTEKAGSFSEIAKILDR
jgi:hypothetical protein